MINTTVDHNGMKIMGYLAEPAGTPKGGMIVIQEWWGLTDDIRAIADRYAAEGYFAFAPDLYHGQVASEPDEARKYVMALERDLAAREIDAGIAWLKDVRGVQKVGCVGYCMGGGLTLATAMRSTSRVDAAHVYYGGGMPADDQLAAIQVSVLGSYGADDAGIPKEQVDRLRDVLTKAGVPNDITLYDGAGHSFFNDTKPSYNPAASADSWTKSLAWFGKYVAS